MSRAIEIRIHDTDMGIWQDDAHDPTFRSKIFLGLATHLRRRGWNVQPHAEIRTRHGARFAASYRICAKGNLLAELGVSGRHIELKVWAETWEKVNTNGHKHDFGKRARLGYLDRLRLDLEFSHIERWLRKRADVKVSNSNLESHGPQPGGLTAIDWIGRQYASSWHKDKEIGRPVCTSPSNARSADGAQLEHGQTVYWPDMKGRICRGVAYYNLNSMWWVVTNRWDLTNESCHRLYAEPPEDLRRKRNGRLRRWRLEAELAKAIRAMDFGRAELLRDLLFGSKPVFLIWARDHQAYYSSNYSGYTTDAISAGKYTFDEAHREVSRVPHELNAVDQTGRHLTADQMTQSLEAAA